MLPPQERAIADSSFLLLTSWRNRHVSVYATPWSRPGIHADRTIGRNRDNRGTDRAIVARCAAGSLGRSAHAVQEQPEANGIGVAQL